LEEAGQVQSFLVAAETEAGARSFLEVLRRHLALGLSPVILAMPFAPQDIQAPFYDALLIPPFSVYQVKKILQEQTHILSRCQIFESWGEVVDEQAQRELQVLRFVHSRQMAEITPQPDRESPVGYSVPWAEALLAAGRGASIEMLNRYAQEGFWLTELLDKVNLCPQCGDYRLNIREVCPVCGSPDITREKTIQHFPCAHVAPESTFVEEERYICPKCRKPLKHIGVDYAKPGEMVVCGHCREVFAEPETSCLSLVCGQVFAPLALKQMPIYRYQLSQKGVEGALRGLHRRSTLSDVLKSFLNIYHYEFFCKYLQMEVKRSLRYQHPFSLIRLAIANAQDLEASLGLKGKLELVREIETILGSSIRETDMISFAPDGDMVILLLDCDKARAEMVLKRILAKSKEVLAAPLTYKYHITCVPDQVRDYEALLSPPGMESG
jgi:GGDEF domain-containing protein